MTIVEDAPTSDFLKTELPKIVEEASMQTVQEQYAPEQPLKIGDAAILMAADGYGKGTIKGRNSSQIIVIKTSETALNFTFDKAPDQHELYLKSLSIFEEVKERRHMEHGE